MSEPDFTDPKTWKEMERQTELVKNAEGRPRGRCPDCGQVRKLDRFGKLGRHIIRRRISKTTDVCPYVGPPSELLPPR